VQSGSLGVNAYKYCNGPWGHAVIRAEGGFGQGVPQWVMGEFLGSKQVYLRFAKLTPNKLNCIGMESPLTMECNLSQESISCEIELI